MNILEKLKGWKKITAAAIGLLAALLGPELLNLDQVVVDNVISVITYYLLGQGAADLGAYMKK